LSIAAVLFLSAKFNSAARNKTSGLVGSAVLAASRTLIASLISPAPLRDRDSSILPTILEGSRFTTAAQSSRALS